MAQSRIIGSASRASRAQRSIQLVMDTLQLLSDMVSNPGGDSSQGGLQGMSDGLKSNQGTAGRQVQPSDDASGASDADDTDSSRQQDPMMGLLQALKPLLQAMAQWLPGGDDSGTNGSGAPTPLARKTAGKLPAGGGYSPGPHGGAGGFEPPGASGAPGAPVVPGASGAPVVPGTPYTAPPPATVPLPKTPPSGGTAPPPAGGISSSPPVGSAGTYTMSPDTDPSAGPASGSPTTVNADGTFSKAGVTGQLSPAQTKDMAVNVAQRLEKDFGLTQAQAAGLVGNLDHESVGLNSNVNEIGVDPSSPTFGAPNSSQFGYGWAQWTGSRKTDMLNYAKANGLDPSSPEANYQMLKHELETTESATVPALKAAGTAEEAATVFRKVFERATNPVDQSRIANAAVIEKWLTEAQGS